MAVKNMKELREKVLKALEDLEAGTIDISQAATIAKMSETVVSGLKSEMQYAILTNTEPFIPFFGKEGTKVLDHKNVKKIIIK